MTYTSYQQVWQRLICFTYWSSCPSQTVLLHYQLTTRQLAALNQMVEAGTHLLWDPDGDPREPARLDQACLALLIVLLDHPLKGEIYESIVVGFLAVLGVDPQR